MFTKPIWKTSGMKILGSGRMKGGVDGVERVHDPIEQTAKLTCLILQNRMQS